MFCTKVTPLGRDIAAFPVAPCFGKMLALSHQQNLMKYTICMVAALSVQEVLIETGIYGRVKNIWLEKHRKWAEDHLFFLGTLFRDLANVAPLLLSVPRLIQAL